MSVQTQIDRITGNVSEQNELIQQIKTALNGKATGGVELPTLTNPGTANDLAEGVELIDADGKKVTGTMPQLGLGNAIADGAIVSETQILLSGPANISEKRYVNPSDTLIVRLQASNTEIMSKFGDATEADVVAGKTFTSSAGVKKEGTATLGITPSGTRNVTDNGIYDVTNYASVNVNVAASGSTIKSGTTTSRTIDTGLSDIEQFFMYKETQTGTGLIHLHYTKSATSRMYASAWSTQNYGTKTITNGTGGVTVNGGTLTISATQATQGALTSNVTYKWVAIGKE